MLTRRDRLSRSLASVVCLAAVAAACDRARPPWERAALQAEATVHGPDLDLRGRMTFVRPRSPDLGTLQFDVTRDGHLDNATLLASGKTTAFTDGVPRAIARREEQVLAVLAALVAWPAVQADRRPTAGGAIVRLRDGRGYTVLLGPEASGGPHQPQR